MSGATQRRGNKGHKPEPTQTATPSPAVSTGAANPQPPALATVRRRYCGTGPFDRHWLNVDCCGLFCACFTYLLHAYGVYAVCCIMLPPWMSYTTEGVDGNGGGVRYLSVAGIVHRTAFTTIAALAVVSHFKAMTTDPGAVPPDATPLPEPDDESQDQGNGDSKRQESNSLLIHPMPKGRRLCRRCKAFKPQRAHHCSVCKRCIIKMDHHCPWVNNCVGIGNHKYFLLFVLYTFLSCSYAIILIIARFTTCLGHRREPSQAHQPNQRNGHCLDEPAHLLYMLGLLVECLLFGMFTLCMMFDQLDVVQSKVTHIDRFKGIDLSGSLPGVTEVFGAGKRGVDAASRFRPDWLSPFSKVCFPPSVRDEVMGFCRPSCSDKTSSFKASQPSNAKKSSPAAAEAVDVTTATTELVSVSNHQPQQRKNQRSAADLV